MGKKSVRDSEEVRSLIPPCCSGEVWGLVGPVAVFSRASGSVSFPGACPVLVGGVTDQDGQYFSPREV